ncbi:AbrB/MazE/SpoVT family DNA-binding domain-containing protein [Candidatus Shapirobacteria bacterium]|nr:AbrB/MazE/SpoVT family DNA-binding domain-containing protein [Candidatus Shapirobacteria bacterium]
MKRKVIKTGNSLAVTIPHQFVKGVGVKAGDEVEFKINTSKSRLLLKFIKKAKQIALFK